MFVNRAFLRPWSFAVVLGFGTAGAMIFAQIEGSDRTEAAIDGSANFEVAGVAVDVVAPTAEAARLGGWREAQRRGWRLLWQRTHGNGAPGLSDAQLDGIVAGIVVENEQIGPNRYVAKLGILFDRVRTSQILGITGLVSRSAPLLVIPVQWTGGTAQAFEVRTEWRKAWARFRNGSSPIDYVRPSGMGADALLLTAAQTTRPGRRWWRLLLDQYGAADVLIPQVRLERRWPGGPVIANFSARYGPDNRLLQTFSLRVDASLGLPAMLDEGVRRMDQIYANALAAGQLRPDATLVIEEPVLPEEVANSELPVLPVDGLLDLAAPGADTVTAPLAKAATFTVQFETPDVSSVSAIETAVRGIPGMKSASTSSLALGGVSVMRITFEGDVETLKLALTARGFSVRDSGGSLRISRAGQ